jgi:hypothetical protein
MSLWRREAFEKLPELRTELQEAENPMQFWIEVSFVFRDAFERGNLDLFKRILQYADWSFHAPRGKDAGTDPATCIHVAFFEHMPQVPSAPEVDSSALGVELLSWNGPTITHPHVKALHDDLVRRQRGPTNS